MATASQDKWEQALLQWAIPKEILEQAQENPWIHPPALYVVPEKIEITPSHWRALEAMSEGGSLLDVGCGGGMAAFAVTPPASHVIGVDHQSEMLDMFSANAKSRGVSCEVYEGFWPDIAGKVPLADVVATHHVVYNVAHLGPFIRALDSHARKRVIIEMPREIWTRRLNICGFAFVCHHSGNLKSANSWHIRQPRWLEIWLQFGGIINLLHHFGPNCGKRLRILLEVGNEQGSLGDYWRGHDR
jgi:SAM-dependent methyltransferase